MRLSDTQFESLVLLSMLVVPLVVILIITTLLAPEPSVVHEIIKLCPVDDEVMQMPCKDVFWMGNV